MGLFESKPFYFLLSGGCLMFSSSVGAGLSRKCNPMGGCHFPGGCSSLKYDSVGGSGLFQQVPDWIACCLLEIWPVETLSCIHSELLGQFHESDLGCNVGFHDDLMGNHTNKFKW